MNSLSFSVDAVVLANGAFPTHEVPLEVLRQAPRVVCCDGAISHWPTADVVVGDGDSVPEQYRNRLAQIDEQDDNDLTKATRYCLHHYAPTLNSSRPLRVAYLGATGMREDHTIGNIALLVRYHREMGILPVMLTDYGWFEPASGRHVFHSFERQQVSLFNFGCQQFQSEGLRWACYPYKEWWQGTLNESTGQTFTIDADGTYLVYRTYEPKQ